jgi:uncharacterized protein (DUF2225 family)
VQPTSAVQEPTFDKKQHAKAKKEKSMFKIAWYCKECQKKDKERHETA